MLSGASLRLERAMMHNIYQIDMAHRANLSNGVRPCAYHSSGDNAIGVSPSVVFVRIRVFPIGNVCGDPTIKPKLSAIV